MTHHGDPLGIHYIGRQQCCVGEPVVGQRGGEAVATGGLADVRGAVCFLNLNLEDAAVGHADLGGGIAVGIEGDHIILEGGTAALDGQPGCPAGHANAVAIDLPDRHADDAVTDSIIELDRDGIRGIDLSQGSGRGGLLCAARQY